MSSQFKVTTNGIYRADALEEFKRERAQNAARRKELYGRHDSFTNEQRIAEVKETLQKRTNLDANETNFAARELLHIMKQTKEVIYPGDILEEAFPVTVEGGSGLLSMGYQQLDYTGEFKMIGAQANDLPEVGASQAEYTKPVGVFGATYGWSQIELERAARGNVPLNARKGKALMLAAKKTKNKIAWGDDSANYGGVTGLFNTTGSLISATTIAGTWASANADAILADCRAVINQVRATTEDYEADTLVMDPVSYGYMTARLSNSDTTVAEFVMAKLGIRRILYTSALTSVTSADNSLSADKVLLAYPRDSMLMEFMLPRDIQQLPMQVHGMQYVTPVLFDSAGLFIYKGVIAHATGM